MMKKTVVVTAATGRQGGATAQYLMADGFQVRAFVRDAESASARRLAQAGAELAVGNMDDPDSVAAAMRGAHGAFSLQPSLIPPHFAENELQRGLTVADAAHTARICHLVYVSVAGADKNTSIPHWKIKWHIEQHIRRIGVPFTILRPTMFMDNYADATHGVTSDNSVLRMIPPRTIVQHIAITDIGAFAALALRNPAHFIGKAMELAGDELTADQIAVAITRTVRRPIPALDLLVSSKSDLRELGTREFVRFGGWQADIEALRALHPKLMTFDAWLKQGGAALIENLLKH
jgi:uncharacterized protein YbjT (DUF2867 family)